MEKINSDRFYELLKSQKVMVVDFFATWCRPCSMMTPILEKVDSDMDNVSIYKLDVDECGDVAQEYGILSIPCMIVYKDGKEVDRIIGFTQEEDVRNTIDKYLK